MMRILCTLTVLTAVLAGGGLRATAAPPEWNVFFPAGGRIGSRVAVSATGKFSRWPIQFWVDRPGVTVSAGEKQGELQVDIAEDAIPGLYWIRGYDQEGATALRPFLVDQLEEIVEGEPNNTLAEANLLEGPRVANGKLARSGDLDTFAIDLRQGETLVASLRANQELGSPMDGVLQLVSPDGFVLAQNDDARGVDPQLAWQVSHDGRYALRVFAFPLTPTSSISFAGGDNFVYRLTATTGGFVDHVLPSAATAAGATDVRLFGWNLDEGAARQIAAGASPVWIAHPGAAAAHRLERVEHPVGAAAEPTGEARPSPRQLPLPSVQCGRIGAPGQHDEFSFEGAKGRKVRFEVEADALGFLLDPHLSITDADGKVLAEVDDTNSQRDCRLDFTPQADGPYRLVLRDVHRHGGFRYVYRLTAASVQPDFRLKLPQDAFAVKAGETVAVKVEIERQDGFAEEIEIEAVDLPAGVTAEPVISPAKGDQAKAVTITLKAAADAASGPFRIEGSSAELTRAAFYEVLGTRLERAWVTRTP